MRETIEERKRIEERDTHKRGERETSERGERYERNKREDTRERQARERDGLVITAYSILLHVIQSL